VSSGFQGGCDFGRTWGRLKIKVYEKCSASVLAVVSIKNNPSDIATLPPISDTRILYSREDAAYQLSISVSTLDRLIGGKHLAARRIGRKVLVPHIELMKISRRDIIQSL
jgi:excisionase family DNA binding protein